MKIRTTPSSLCYATAGIALGILGQSWQQQHNNNANNPILEACTSTDYKNLQDFVDQTGYQPYNLRVGLVLADAAVCVMTQKLYQSSTAGYLIQGFQFLQLQFPLAVLVFLEAGRKSNQGLLLWSTVVSLLCYSLGTSVVFPSLWFAAFCLLGDQALETTHPQRGPAALYLALPSIFLFLVTILLSRNSSLWNLSAALLGSPILALFPLIGWFLPPPEQQPSSGDAIHNAKTIAKCYAIMGGIGFVGWMVSLYAYWTTYGSNYAQFWDDAAKDHCGQWMELFSLGMAWILFLAFKCPWSALEAALLVTLIGPAAAIAVELATLELEHYSVPKSESQIQHQAATKQSKQSTKKKKKKE